MAPALASWLLRPIRVAAEAQFTLRTNLAGHAPPRRGDCRHAQPRPGWRTPAPPCRSGAEVTGDNRAAPQRFQAVGCQAGTPSSSREGATRGGPQPTAPSTPGCGCVLTYAPPPPVCPKPRGVGVGIWTPGKILGSPGKAPRCRRPARRYRLTGSGFKSERTRRPGSPSCRRGALDPDAGCEPRSWFPL